MPWPRWLTGRPARPAPSAAAPTAIPADPAATGTGHPNRAADPTRRYVAGGGSSGGYAAYLNSAIATVLGRVRDDIDRKFGDDIKRRMLRDPAVKAATNYLIYGLVEHDAEVVPRHSLEPGTEAEADPEAVARARDSAEAAAFCRRLLEGMDEPIEDVALQMGRFVGWGAELAEIVAHVPESGPDAGRLMLKALKVKDRSRWNFVVDGFMDVVGILAVGGDGTGLQEVLPPDKFCWLSWWPEGGDPRGTSIIREAFDPWFGKHRLWPELLKHLARFGSPMLVGITAPDATDLDAVDADGNPIAGARVTPEEAMRDSMVRGRNGETFALPHGSDLKVVQPVGYNVLGNGYDLYDRQIVLSILNATRAILESAYGSRADSMTAADVAETIKKVIRHLFERMIAWSVFHRFLAWNFGPEHAAEHCPSLSLGESDGDLAALLDGWVKAGWKADPETHYPAIDARVGLRPRDPDKIRERQEAMARVAAAAANQGPPGGDDDGGGDGDV